jgi:hypothetical protein
MFVAFFTMRHKCHKYCPTNDHLSSATTSSYKFKSQRSSEQLPTVNNSQNFGARRVDIVLRLDCIRIEKKCFHCQGFWQRILKGPIFADAKVSHRRHGQKNANCLINCFINRGQSYRKKLNCSGCIFRSIQFFLGYDEYNGTSQICSLRPGFVITGLLFLALILDEF